MLDLVCGIVLTPLLLTLSPHRMYSLYYRIKENDGTSFYFTIFLTYLL